MWSVGEGGKGEADVDVEDVERESGRGREYWDVVTV